MTQKETTGPMWHKKYKRSLVVILITVKNRVFPVSFGRKTETYFFRVTIKINNGRELRKRKWRGTCSLSGDSKKFTQQRRTKGIRLVLVTTRCKESVKNYGTLFLIDILHVFLPRGWGGVHVLKGNHITTYRACIS